MLDSSLSACAEIQSIQHKIAVGECSATKFNGDGIEQLHKGSPADALRWL